MARTEGPYPEGFTVFLAFLCKKHKVDPKQVFISYDTGPPPPLRGGRHGYYDGLLSYRERNGISEFLITVFKVARNPLLTLGHEFAHIVDDLKRGSKGGVLGPPDEAREKQFDLLAMRDLAAFQARKDKVAS